MLFNNHDLKSAGHPGQLKTVELVSRNYWWPNWRTYVKKYVDGCDVCQRIKNRPQKPYGPLIPNQVPSKPWEIISCNLITQLPESDGYNAICVVVDWLTKRAHFFAITNEFSAKDLAELLYSRVWSQHGLPKQIISDRGTQFAAQLFQEWCQLLEIKSSMSTTYHPQTDGQTERVNQTLEQYLRAYVDYQKTDWSWLLHSAEFAYNNATHESTKESPFFLEYGRHPRAGPEPTDVQAPSTLTEVSTKRFEAQEQAKAALALAAERIKWYYDKNIQKVPFSVGDKVMLDLRDYQTSGRKLNPCYEGPFEIIEKLSEVTFRLKWPDRLNKIHPVFHASKLVPYTQSEIPGQKPVLPPPEMINGHKEWEVESIESVRTRRYCNKTKLQYLVKWRGSNETTWEPEGNLTHCKEALDDFYRRNPNTIWPVSIIPKKVVFAVQEH